MSLCDPECDPADGAAATAALLATLVEAFYARVRADARLGPIFDGAVEDWPAHLARLTRFWSAVLQGDGGYKGQPVQAHLRLAPAMTPENFAQWLSLWRATTDELCPPAMAQALQSKATRIAESLVAAIEPVRLRAQWRNLPLAAEPARPYRSTPEFDEASIPQALRRAHRTKAGVWGVIRVLEGRLRLRVEGVEAAVELSPGCPAAVRPEQPHHVEVDGPVRMVVDFYDAPPPIAPVG